MIVVLPPLQHVPFATLPQPPHTLNGDFRLLTVGFWRKTWVEAPISDLYGSISTHSEPKPGIVDRAQGIADMFRAGRDYNNSSLKASV